MSGFIITMFVLYNLSVVLGFSKLATYDYSKPKEQYKGVDTIALVMQVAFAMWSGYLVFT